MKFALVYTTYNDNPRGYNICNYIIGFVPSWSVALVYMNMKDFNVVHGVGQANPRANPQECYLAIPFHCFPYVGAIGGR